ncbi:hypothetical protein MKW98_004715 [Papaver atlanticum]|uniref:Agenet domain-containing protein n=1 Tax=Papaver atlanticum TaxID=357466 RepID=A0AAD4XI61_9MAGN|nr:hypothetical protein MKW98_004715 [Papaver atlanticum]
MAETHFEKGDEVEVCSSEEGFRGAWFSGKVVKAVNKNKKVYIQYDNLVEDEKTLKPLKEFVDVFNVRPIPPHDSDSEKNNHKISDSVDAFYEDAWWEGVVTKILENGNKFVLYFRDSKEELEIDKDKLRVHREWVHGSWVPPPLDEEQSQQQEKEHPQHQEEIQKPHLQVEEQQPQQQEEEIVQSSWIKVGDTVEVTGFAGSWFDATVVKKTNENKYLIEYLNLKSEDETKLLRKEVEIKCIRPIPPCNPKLESYSLLQEVDAEISNGWWCGVVSKVLSDSKYIVFFRESSEELEYDHSQLRPHQDWVGGKWVRASVAP